MTNFEMTDRRRRRTKVVPRAAMDFVQQLIISPPDRHDSNVCWESMAGYVIQTTGTLDFDDGLRTGVLLEGCWCH